MNEPAHKEHMHHVASELVTNGSIEFSSGEHHLIAESVDLLPRGISVYLPVPIKRPFGSNLDTMRALHEAGFEAVPHLAARAIPSRHELLAYLEAAAGQFGVHRVLLIGGDRDTAIGPYANSAQVLEDGVLAGAGINEVGVAGYPEGHPGIPVEILQSDLELKQELAARQGLGLEIVTQFSFVPSRVTEYCAELARTAPDVPVYIGLAGPTPNRTLRRYARHCGVSASLRALTRLGILAAETATHTEPGNQLTALAHFCAARDSCNVIGAHLYSFGGFLETARWMRQRCRLA